MSVFSRIRAFLGSQRIPTVRPPEFSLEESRVVHNDSMDLHLGVQELYHRAASGAVDSALLKLERESRELFVKHEKALEQARVYRSAAAVLAVALSAGLTAILWKAEDYVDSRIAQRVVKSDRMALALNQAQFGRWRDALALLDELRRDSETGEAANDAQFRNFLFANLIWVLAGIEEIDPDGQWAGQRQYESLMQDRRFINEVLTAGDAGRDPGTSLSLALCTLKYDQSSLLAPARAERYLRHAAARLDRADQRADAHWNLSLLYLVRGNMSVAQTHLDSAASLHPVYYDHSDLRQYRNTFLNSPEFQMWSTIARRAGNERFGRDYIALISRGHDNGEDPPPPSGEL